MVLVVVEGDCLFVDEGLESVIGIGQRRQLALTDLARGCATTCCGLTLCRGIEAFHADQYACKAQTLHHVSSCYFISHDISSPGV
jgi:hypothetical protein